jgi:hypothetical protein
MHSAAVRFGRALRAILSQFAFNAPARMIVLICTIALMAGCARSSVIPLANDTVQITSSAAPICGMAGAQSVAVRQAAVETIRRGYDKFLIQDGAYQSTVGVVGYTPVVAQSNGTATVYGNRAYGTSTTTVTGGQPTVGGHHNQALIVKMFKDGDAAGANAVSARQTLGPKWQDDVQSNAATCAGG